MKWIARRFPLVLAAGLLFVLGSCQDAVPPMGPELAVEDSVAAFAPDSADHLLSGLIGALTGARDNPEVDVLRRTDALERTEVARARVGLLGATLHLREAGLTVSIPPGAAPLGTWITVTAPAGDLVGYHFAPHGLKFRLPVTLTQRLRGTEAAQGLLRPTVGAYFDGELAPVVEALEILPLQLVGGLTGSAIFPISHFSGYIVATN